MDNTDFVNSYIVKLAHEFAEKCKETVVLGAKLEWAEKANGGLAERLTASLEKLEAAEGDLAQTRSKLQEALLGEEGHRVAHDQLQVELRNLKFRLESENGRLASRLANAESVLAAKQAELDALKTPAKKASSKKKRDGFEGASVT